MSRYTFAAMLLAGLSAAPFVGVHAQVGTTDAAASRGVRDPGDPKATVPAVRYTSAFERYRPNAEVDLSPWRQSNDNVGRIGGWRVYGREAVPDGKPLEPARAERDAQPASAAESAPSPKGAR